MASGKKNSLSGTRKNANAPRTHPGGAGGVRAFGIAPSRIIGCPFSFRSDKYRTDLWTGQDRAFSTLYRGLCGVGVIRHPTPHTQCSIEAYHKYQFRTFYRLWLGVGTGLVRRGGSFSVSYTRGYPEICNPHIGIPALYEQA